MSSRLDLGFLVLSAPRSGLLKAGGSVVTIPLIKGGGPLGLVPCGETVEVGLIAGRDISGGGPSGLTDALVDRVPGGDISLLGLRDTDTFP